MPITIATNVLISSSALARDSSLSGSISGTMPYFAGLKKVECSAIRNSTTSISSMRVEKNAASAEQHHEISKTLTRDQHRALADDVRQMAGVSREQQERDHKYAPASDRYSLPDPCGAATCTARMRNDDLVDVVVEGARNCVHRNDWNPRSEAVLEAACSMS